MNIASIQPLDGMTHVSSAPACRKFIVLGGPAPDISGLNWLNLEGAAGLHCDAIILLKHIEPHELAKVLEQAPDPAVPIADFFGNHPVRRDFIGSLLNDDSAAEIHHSLGQIWRRLAELPFRSNREDRWGLTLLRLAYSRDAPAQAAFNPGYPLTVQYPLFGTSEATRHQLESLANHDLFNRRHFTRTHACSKCGSARLHVYEACPGCNGADLVDEVVVHHYRCGCQEPESRFIQGPLLVCPKCRRELRHLGVDYGKPGKIVLCRTCGAVNSEPLVHFICLDCSRVTPADAIPSTDWYHYDLTAKGLSTLHEGQLPRFELASALERSARAYSPREFGLLAMQEMRAARQFQRPFSVARVSFPNIDAVQRDLGLQATNTAIRQAADAVVGAVRASDFVGIGGPMSVVIGLPGIARTDVGPIEDRIRKAIYDTVVAPLELAVEVAEGDAINAMLARG